MFRKTVPDSENPPRFCKCGKPVRPGYIHRRATGKSILYSTCEECNRLVCNKYYERSKHSPATKKNRARHQQKMREIIRASKEGDLPDIWDI